MTTAEVLQKARDLITDPEHWTHRTFARDESGYQVEPNEPSATCWCALGAVYHVLGTNEEEGAEEVEPIRVLDRRNVVEVNDFDGHGATLALFDQLIAEASA